MKYSTELFEKLNDEKKDRVIQAAIKEFSEKGFENANTNKIAKLANISVGSLFKYFRSKNDLFLYIVEIATSELEKQVGRILDQDKAFFDTVEDMLILICEYSKNNKALIRLYHEMTSIGQASLATKVVTSFENLAGSHYQNMVKEAQEKGGLRDDLDPAVVAFTLDNIFVSLQFSYALPYYMERKKLFLGKEIKDKDLINESMLFIKKALASKEKD
ncbi:MAG: TetR/AcrR family transcriptional regulator [Tissierellia bacterium]|nr:TetR/AcrR family transcriptional regulator [Tissierellia bacterium]